MQKVANITHILKNLKYFVYQVHRATVGGSEMKEGIGNITSRGKSSFCASIERPFEVIPALKS